MQFYGRMYLEKIILTQFKNYASQSLTLSKRLNCFVGLNGVGKTNLLDAIYYLCLCKSHFLASDLDVVLRGSDFTRLEGHFMKNNTREKIVAKVQPRKKKTIERNDVAYAALSEHIGFLPVVMFAPDDTLLAKEGSEERRRFIDNVLSQIDNQYLTNLIFYNKILEQRNALLKKSTFEGKNGQNTEGVDLDLLKIYDAQMLNPAAFIFEKRREFTEHFSPIFNEIYLKISDAKEQVLVTYSSQLLTDSLQNLFVKNREKDFILHRTTTGIHKDDWSFEIDEKPLKRFGSQGQLKTFVLALKLAQYEILRGIKNETPILLLDDIFDKLDANRVENLLQLIVNQSFGQIFITDTHLERMREMTEKLGVEFKIFTVENAEVKEV